MGITVKNVSKVREVKAAVKSLAGKKIKVGIVGGESDLSMIAAVHEYGTSIKVTPKMRGWFAANGYPLKKETTQIVIPERSFLRAGFDEHEDEVFRKIEDLMPAVLELHLNAGVFVDTVGREMAGKIQKKIKDIKSPANSQMTKERKGSSNPLVDSGRLVGAIDHRVE